jgi:hypothetical protein
LNGLSHIEAIKVHATKRFKERFGVALPYSDYDRMVGVLNRGEGRPVAHAWNGHPIFQVRYGGAVAYALYKGGMIVTFVPDPKWAKRAIVRSVEGVTA